MFNYRDWWRISFWLINGVGGNPHSAYYFIESQEQAEKGSFKLSTYSVVKSSLKAQ